MQRALKTARRLYGAEVRIIAAANVTVYCTIAVARHGDKAIVGVALGRRSATESDSLASEQCLKAGGPTHELSRVGEGNSDSFEPARVASLVGKGEVKTVHRSAGLWVA